MRDPVHRLQRPPEDAMPLVAMAGRVVLLTGCSRGSGEPLRLECASGRPIGLVAR